MLKGERICLGPVLRNDAPVLFRWANDRGLALLNGPYAPRHQAGFDAWLAGAEADPTRALLTVRELSDMRLLGYAHVMNIHPVFRSAEIGMVIGEAADRGRGLGTEAMALVMSHCWRDLALERLSLFVYGDNARALGAWRRAGFVQEGVLRGAAFVDGRRVDVTVLGALKSASGD